MVGKCLSVPFGRFESIQLHIGAPAPRIQCLRQTGNRGVPPPDDAHKVDVTPCAPLTNRAERNSPALRSESPPLYPRRAERERCGLCFQVQKLFRAKIQWKVKWKKKNCTMMPVWENRSNRRSSRNTTPQIWGKTCRITRPITIHRLTNRRIPTICKNTPLNTCSTPWLTKRNWL